MCKQNFLGDAFCQMSDDSIAVHGGVCSMGFPKVYPLLPAASKADH